MYGTKPHVPDYFVMNDDIYRIITDHLGSVRLVVRVKDGSIVQEMVHDEFGKTLSSAGAGFQPFGFAGGLYDYNTGFIQFGARWYDPQVGRWVSKDPIGFAGGDTNLYAYVGGNPVSYVDPTGLYWFRQSWQEPGKFGRPGTRIAPGGPVSEFAEQHFPAAYTFAVIHDDIVDFGLNLGLPDWAINFTTMAPAYAAALHVEFFRSVGILDQPTPQGQTKLSPMAPQKESIICK